VTVRFDAWKQGEAAPSTHTVRVESPKVALTLEPVAPELRKTLVHPDRKASVGSLHFSPDGARLFVSGYPSGVVQIFDMASGKELRRIAGPRGFRSSSEYAVPSADWKTVYVAVESRKTERVEKDGKTVFVPNYTGEVRVFDVATGEEKPPLKRDGNGAVATVQLAGDGKALLTVESLSSVNDKGERSLSNAVFEWDPVARSARKLQDGYGWEKRSKDGRWRATAKVDYQALTARLTITDTKVVKETVLLDEKNRAVGFLDLSPDGRFLAASVSHLGGKETGSEVRVWDLGTMKPVSPPPMKADYFADVTFSPDGKLLALWAMSDGTRLLDTTTWKERSLPGKDAKDHFQRYAFSADGKRLAVAASRIPAAAMRTRDPDPLDYPQPRIYLYDLTSDATPKVLICPQGFVVHLTFTPDGKRLAAGASGGVLLFELP
jgi:WD40 repeat protein